MAVGIHDTTTGAARERVTEHEGTSDEADERSLSVFVNYRREDTAADARLVYERLSRRFGRENVFLDVVDLQPGTSWLDAIKSRGGSSGAFVVLIGPRWLTSMTERAEAQLENPSPDIVKMELELALARDSGVYVVPVLVGDAAMPNPDRLPRSIRRLSEIHAVELRHTRFDEDIGYLIAVLEAITRRAEPRPPASQSPAPPPTRKPASTLPPSSTSVPPAPSLLPGDVLDGSTPGPDQRHYETVARHMFVEGTLVPVLGARVYGSLPDADEIAADLARRFELDPDPPALPRVAQQVYVSSGRPDLLRTLRRILASEREPSAVHRFLARFPQQLGRLGLPPRYQMIVTTNYDSTLERAFDEENEPYDLAVYVGAGEDRGKFVHFPIDREPELISVPNRYNRFPIDDFGDLQRSIIVKIHGGVTGVDADRWGEAFVITEDQYIDYLSAAPVESLVPVQILAKLTESHCLFLGYTMRDWNLRVFLKRIWRGEALGSRSWAVEREPDMLEKDFWKGAQVECFSASLDAYVEQLSRHVSARAADRA